MCHFEKEMAKLQHELIENYRNHTPTNPDKCWITQFSLCATEDSGQPMPSL